MSGCCGTLCDGLLLRGIYSANGAGPAAGAEQRAVASGRHSFAPRDALTPGAQLSARQLKESLENRRCARPGLEKGEQSGRARPAEERAAVKQQPRALRCPLLPTGSRLGTASVRRARACLRACGSRSCSTRRRMDRPHAPHASLARAAGARRPESMQLPPLWRPGAPRGSKACGGAAWSRAHPALGRRAVAHVLPLTRVYRTKTRANTRVPCTAGSSWRWQALTFAGGVLFARA